MCRWVEVSPLPQVCQECEEEKRMGTECACYNCDYTLLRFKKVIGEEETDEYFLIISNKPPISPEATKIQTKQDHSQKLKNDFSATEGARVEK